MTGSAQGIVLSSQRFISLSEKRLWLGGRSVNITPIVLQSNLQKVLTSDSKQEIFSVDSEFGDLSINSSSKSVKFSFGLIRKL